MVHLFYSETRGKKREFLMDPHTHTHTNELRKVAILFTLVLH